MTLTYPYVIKKDGRREPFAREKLLKGLQAACQKRPVGLAQLELLVDRLSLWITGLGEREIPTRMLGERVMSELRSLDDVAYVRFASVYRTFRDIQEFVETLDCPEEKPEQATVGLEKIPAQLSFSAERIFDETPCPGTRTASLIST